MPRVRTSTSSWHDSLIIHYVINIIHVYPILSNIFQSLFDDRDEFNGFTLVCVDLNEGKGAYLCSKGDMDIQYLGEGEQIEKNI